MTGRIIAVAINKGGTGKTTNAVNLAHLAAERALARANGGVCLVDTDPQGNASLCLTDEAPFSGASSLFDRTKVTVPDNTFFPNISVFSADEGLHRIQRLELEAEEILVFRERIQQLAKTHAYVIIDTPPTLGAGMWAALVASDAVFSPVTPDPFALAGVDTLQAQIHQAQESLNPKLRFLGLLLNRFSSRNPDHLKSRENYEAIVGDHLVPYTIGERAPIGNLAITRRPVWHIPTGNGRLAAKEVRAALGWILDEADKK